MEGMIDLHCHPVPAVDDGVRTAEEGAELIAGLRALGFTRVIATPHVRSGVWDNRPETLAGPRAQLEAAMQALAAKGHAMPVFEVAAEHLFDDVTWELFAQGKAMPYPGGKAALLEFPYDSLPFRVELRLWKLKKQGVLPVVAHPERYSPIQRDLERVEELLGAKAKLLLDVMSLTGQYGRSAQTCAEQLLRQGHYTAACTDAHKPADLPKIEAALRVLERSVGMATAKQLLIEGPSKILEGT